MTCTEKNSAPFFQKTSLNELKTSRNLSTNHSIPNSGDNKEKLCFKLDANTQPPYSINFVYFRCNTPYTGKSYSVPGYAQLIAPLLKPAELRRAEIEKKLHTISTLNTTNVRKSDSDAAKENRKTPVLPLDYGGFSEERIRQHSSKVSSFDAENLKRFTIMFPDASDTATIAESNKLNSKKAINNNNNNNQKPLEESSTTTTRTSTTTMLPSPYLPLSSVADRIDVLRYDIPCPKNAPEPLEQLVQLGKQYLPLPKPSELIKYCSAYKKNERILEQPASTYVSVTAKGIKITDYLDLSTSISTIYAAIAKTDQNEPVCPSPKTSPLLEEFDRLPAYKYRNQLKFYWAEKALRDALTTLGDSRQKMNIGEVAARLVYAMQTSNSQTQDGGVDWTLSTASTLYWRVKGDAVNAIKCLRHSLNNSPQNMKDVALISMANIYHQAGFLHSALLVGGRALDISPDSVVAIHFTLANIYMSMGDYSNALKFYYSTLALQSKFQGAKDRIRAIHCETNGNYL